jgi:hypothetical protein
MTVDNYGWSRRNQLMADSYEADQAEAEAIREVVVATTVAMYDERIAQEMEPDDSGPELRIDQEVQADIALDNFSGRLLEEIERRIALLGDDYPFILEDGSLRYRASATGVYEYCLAVSRSPSLTTGVFTELPRYFEILAGDIACHYLGEGSSYIRSGAPAYPPESAIKTFQQAIEHLHTQTNEWTWSPADDAELDQNFIADEGMDFVAWKPIDARKGLLYIIGQCACGRTDWHEKTEDLNLKRLARWVRDLPPVQPVRAFAVPHAVTARRVFGTLSLYAGIPFDRIRLVQIANRPANRAHFQAMHSANLDRLTRLVITNPVLAAQAEA